jgi:hypothetical protein
LPWNFSRNELLKQSAQANPHDGVVHLISMPLVIVLSQAGHTAENPGTITPIVKSLELHIPHNAIPTSGTLEGSSYLFLDFLTDIISFL